ncbi:MAG: alcohol dehydrogenase catalytic domain-containing protein [Syntrophales bacterium]
MRVAMYYNNRDVRLQELPRPKIGPGEMLIKVIASGICGSDVMEWYRIRKAPLVLGHEIAGEIAEIGEGVGRYKIGDRVFVSHHIPCNTCHYCLMGYHTASETLHTTNYDPGGFAEYIRVPKLNVDRGVFLLPEELSFEDGVFIEPLACVVRGQRRRPDQGRGAFRGPQRAQHRDEPRGDLHGLLRIGRWNRRRCRRRGGQPCCCVTYSPRRSATSAGRPSGSLWAAGP